MKNQETVYLSLGSNVGDKVFYLREACALITKNVGKIEQKSSVYATQGWGVSTEQPVYLNQVIEISTNLAPQELLHATQNIEKILGREKNENWAARCIDIDILCYGNQIILQPSHLIVPHIRWHRRLFVLDPLCEIAPEFVHPIFLKTVKELNSELKIYSTYKTELHRLDMD